MNHTERVMEQTITDTSARWCYPTDPGLQALLTRLESQSLQPDFAIQRELAFRLVLQPYFDTQQYPTLSPLPEEVHLAQLYVDADYWPNDGHPTLVEQIRDLITEHVPEEERVWLDAVRHSYMDLLEIMDVQTDGQPPCLLLRSLGDAQEFRVKIADDSQEVKRGQVLLTRLIRQPQHASLPGTAVVISGNIGKAIFNLTDELRREIEIGSGEFALADWPEFSKRYGYLLMWSLIKVRRGALAIANSQVEYLNTNKEPYLYAIALYEHLEFRRIVEELDRLKNLRRYGIADFKPDTEPSAKVWVEQAEPATSESPSPIVARVTVTPSQIMVETDSFERLDALKHQFASMFGFSLHFKGETTIPPSHILPEVDLLSETSVAPPVVVSCEEEHALLSSFLESVYLEWAEQPSASLNGETPRHYGLKSGDKTKVAELINQMEEHDLAYRRTGKVGYDYNILRGHVGV